MKIGDLVMVRDDYKQEWSGPAILVGHYSTGKFIIMMNGVITRRPYCRLATDEENPDIPESPEPDDRVVGDWYFVWVEDARPEVPCVRKYIGNNKFLVDGHKKTCISWTHWERLVQS